MPIETMDDAMQSARALFAETEIENNQPAVEDVPAEPIAEPATEPIQDGAGVEPTPMESATEPTADPASEPMLENAVAAENAAQVAAQQTAQSEAKDAEIERLRRLSEQQASLIEQMSNQQREAIVEEAMEPPAIDLSAIAFDDEASAQQRLAEFTRDMGEYQRKVLLKEMQPYLDQAKAGMVEKEKAQLFAELASDNRFSGMQGMAPVLDNIIANNPELFSDDMPTDKKYVAAYAIAKGIESINAPEPKDPTAEELYELYKKNPELQSMIEQDRIEKIKASQQVPNMAASAGAANAALTIKEKPKNMKDAGEAARKLFIGL